MTKSPNLSGPQAVPVTKELLDRLVLTFPHRPGKLLDLAERDLWAHIGKQVLIEWLIRQYNIQNKDHPYVRPVQAE